MLVHGTDTLDYQQFCQLHSWTLALDQASTRALMLRWERATEICQLDPPWHWHPGVYRVQSAQPDRPDYIVYAGDQGCNCPDGRAGGAAPFGWCKHRLAVWIVEEEFHRQLEAAWAEREGGTGQSK